MRIYSIDEKDRIGKQLAEIFKLKKDKVCKGQWQTTWGSKTNYGLFEVFARIGREISNGTFE